MTSAVVLAAGLATRLRPLSLVRAKAALPVGGVPLVVRILGQLAAAGVTDAVVNLHHLPATLTRLLGDGTGLGLRVRYSWEPEVLGSAGGPRRALALLDGPRALLVNGDTLTDCPYADLEAEHARTGALVTVALVPNREPAKYGGVRLDTTGAFIGFVPAGSDTPSHHFIGVQLVESAAFATLDDGVPASVHDLYRVLAFREPGAVRGLVVDASFLDIGTPLDYWTTHWALATARDGAPEPGAPGSVGRAILWDDVHLDAGAQVRDCIVTDGVRVPAGTWTDAILRQGVGPRLDGEEAREGLYVSRLGVPA
ncbi:MAG: sugar phosphate nucleotidyltransferase [Vicinamibacterales bacterium]